MKEKNKKEMKEIMELLGYTILSAVVVFSVNSRLSQCSREKKDQDKSIESIEAKADTISAARDSVIMLGKHRSR